MNRLNKIAKLLIAEYPEGDNFKLEIDFTKSYVSVSYYNYVKKCYEVESYENYKFGEK